MPLDKKLKLVYCGELMLFVVVFAVLGILFLTGVITPADWKRYLFTYVTLAGTTWLTIDFIWALASKKRRAKVCLLDKILVLPIVPVLMPFDIYCIINGCAENLPYRYFIGGNLVYLAIVYLFMSIYHYYRPTKQMQNIIEQTLAAEAEEEAEANNQNEEVPPEQEKPAELPPAEESNEENN